jgi:hypothetical protein
MEHEPRKDTYQLPIITELLFFSTLVPHLELLFKSTVHRVNALNGGSRNPEEKKYWSHEDRAYSEFYVSTQQLELYTERIKRVLPGLVSMMEDSDVLKRTTNILRFLSQNFPYTGPNEVASFDLEYLKAQELITEQECKHLSRAQAWLRQAIEFDAEHNPLQYGEWQTLDDALMSGEILEQLVENSMIALDEAMSQIRTTLEVDPHVELQALEVLDIFEHHPYPVQLPE